MKRKFSQAPIKNQFNKKSLFLGSPQVLIVKYNFFGKKLVE